METLESAAREFLNEERIAVFGVSQSGQAVGNAVWKKLLDTGHEAFAMHRTATEIDGKTCYPDLKSIPGGVTAVLITTAPDAAPEIVRQCIGTGVRWVWMHRGIGAGSSSPEAEQLCRENGINVLAGACPMMFLEPVDVFHKCLRWFAGRGDRWRTTGIQAKVGA